MNAPSTDRVSAAELIALHLTSCLPPNTPPCYRSMKKARYLGSGRNRVATADIEMFDGLRATIEVFRWGLGGFGHRWTHMAGGNAFYEDGRWQRDREAA